MFRRLLIVNCITLVCALLPLSAVRAGDVFSIRGVEVNEKASSELTAKKQALAVGQREALRRVLRRITLVGDHTRLPQVTDELVAQLIRDFAVSEEKIGGGRYLAKLSVRFKPDAVRTLLQQREIPFAETARLPMVVLPVMIQGQSKLLWDEPNPWFDLWGEIAEPDGLVPLLMPNRELSDVAIVSADQALAGDRERLAKIAEKYNAQGAVIPSAEFTFNKTSKVRRAEIKLITFTETAGAVRAASAYESQPGMSAEEFRKQVATVIVRQLQEDWKTANLLTGAGTNSLVALIPVTKLQQWLAIRERLQQVATIKHIGINRMSIRETVVTIQFHGDTEQLKVALAQQNLALDYRSEENSWTLQLAGQ
jgi:hypothetical protein